jgi:nicotinate-nucleotide--dimethylbenzimidazole phosphoribosyltransferase
MEKLTQISVRDQLLHVIDNKTKPLGALGRLEDIALQIGLIQSTIRPRLDHPHIVVFAGDHGIAATGLVNPYPQAVTAQMVLNFLTGGAAINVFCRQHDLGLTVVDAGVNFDFGTGLYPGKLLSRKVGYGTRNYLGEAAMSAEEAREALGAGADIVSDLHEKGCNCIGFGEMGIGNSSSAALIMSYVTGIPVEECVGRGTGVNEVQLDQKKEVLRSAFRRHLPVIAAQPDAMTILQQVGGFEIAMMTGAYKRAAQLKMVILVDGFISTSALLLARLMKEDILDYCFFSHVSGESGHAKMLAYLGARPLLDLGMRLGEGTGAAMAWPLLTAAVQFLREMASFESAGVSPKSIA